MVLLAGSFALMPSAHSSTLPRGEEGSDGKAPLCWLLTTVLIPAA